MRRISTLLRFSRAPSPPPSILFVLPWNPESPGGVNQVVRSLHKNIPLWTGYRSLLLINAYPHRKVSHAESQSAGRLYQFYLQAPIDTRRRFRSCLSYVFHSPLTLFRLLQFVRQENVRVVNFHYPSLSVATVLLGRWFARCKFRIVLSFHGLDLQSAKSPDHIQRWLWRAVLERCDVVVTCSRSLSADLLQAYPAVGPKVRVIHNGVVIDACERAARTTALPTELEGRRYIISVGTFE